MSQDSNPTSQPTTPDGRWRWDGAQWVPNETLQPKPGPTEGFGTPDGSTAETAYEASSSKKPSAPSLKVGAAALAVLGLVGIVAASVAASDARGSASEVSGSNGSLEDVAGVDQWPDGTRVDFKEGAKQQFSQWHMQEAISNWYANGGAICDTVTVDGPSTLVEDIVDDYEATARAFGDDAYSIGWATAVLAVDQCPNAYAYVADTPRTDARDHYEAARKAAAETAEAEEAVREKDEMARSASEEADQAALRQAQLEYWPSRAEDITWDSTVCRDWRESGNYSDSGGDASAEVDRFYERFKEVENFNWSETYDEARGMLRARCAETAAPDLPSTDSGDEPDTGSDSPTPGPEQDTGDDGPTPSPEPDTGSDSPAPGPEQDTGDDGPTPGPEPDTGSDSPAPSPEPDTAQ